MDQAAEQRRAKERLVRAVEARRTMRDSAYERQVDALISRASREATATIGKVPPGREPRRVVTWEQAWSREFHRAMDALCLARGLRRQSYQQEA